MSCSHSIDLLLKRRAQFMYHRDYGGNPFRVCAHLNTVTKIEHVAVAGAVARRLG